MSLRQAIDYDFPDMAPLSVATSPRSPVVIRRATMAPSSTQAPGLNANGVCVIILAILAIIVLWNMQRSMTGGGYGVLESATSAMKARMGRKADIVAVSEHVNDIFFAKDTAKKIADTAKVQNPTLCTDESCKNYKELKPEDKAKNDAKVKQAIAAKPHALVLVWAPWCGHCHNAMPVVAEAAKHIEDGVILVNSELVSSEMLREGGLAQVTHFPFIMCGGRVFDGPVEKDELKKFADEAKSASATKVDDKPKSPSHDSLNSYFW